THCAHEAAWLRKRVSLRPQRGGRLRRGRELPARRHAADRMVSADRPRAGSEAARTHRRAAAPRCPGAEEAMIDIQLLRKDADAVARRLATRGPGAFDAEQFRRVEDARKNLQPAVQQAQAARNRIAKDIGLAKARGHDVSELLAQAEKLKSLLEQSEEDRKSTRLNSSH